jgi:ubiquinone/menaquinone biosynthesis C-methylase UbiE
MDDANRYFQSRFIFNPKRDAVWKEICRFLQKRYISEEAKILEIGAGHCHFINQIVGKERHALDVSTELSLYAAPGVISHVQSCVRMDEIEDHYFDVVFASNLFEHLAREETKQTLSEVSRVLHQNGKLILIQPNFKYCYKDYFDDYTHIQVFTHTGLSDLLVASGFSILDLKPRFLPFSMKSNLPKASWLVRLYLQSPMKPFSGQMLVVAKN